MGVVGSRTLAMGHGKAVVLPHLVLDELMKIAEERKEPKLKESALARILRFTQEAGRPVCLAVGPRSAGSHMDRES